MIKLRFWRRSLYRRVARLRDSKVSIARGMALGVIVGCVMPPGLQIPPLIAAALFLRVNPFAAFVGTLISNPLTYFPLYLLTCRVGELFLGLFGPSVGLGERFGDALASVRHFEFLSPIASLHTVFDQLGPFVAYWLCGGLIVGLAASVPTYYLSYVVVLEIQKLRGFSQSRRRARRERLAAREAVAAARPTGDPDEEAPDEQPPPRPG